MKGVWVNRQPVPWEAEPHTKAKHDLYRHYLDKWMPIIVQSFGGKATYAEGFSGPGVYLDKSPGSPVIALRALLDHKELKGQVKQVRLLFVDRDERCTTLLEKRLQAAANNIPLPNLLPHGIDVRIVTGSCEPELERLLTRTQAWGKPILAVLDTWGGSVPLDLVRKVAANASSEVIITIQPQYFARFAESSDIGHGDKVFGGTGWRAVADQPASDKARWLMQHYRQTVQGAGFSYVLDFELIDRRGAALYLVFGTTHKLGLQKMKEALWEVDSAAGVGYRDPRDPGQQTLDIEFEPQTQPLQRLLLDHLATVPNQEARIYMLRRFALFQTVFKESQFMPAVRDMIDKGELVLVSGNLPDFNCLVRRA